MKSFIKGENWSNGDQTDILIGIENYDDFTQANIDAGVVAYSVGIIYGKLQQKINLPAVSFTFYLRLFWKPRFLQSTGV